MLRTLWLILLLTFCRFPALAQEGAGGQPAKAGGVVPAAEVPLVTFTLDFPQSQPEYYAIRIPFSGSGHYESRGRLNVNSEAADSEAEDQFDFEFTMSRETRLHIFDLAAKADYFQKELDAHAKHLAFTGKKALSYKDANRAYTATYSYSSNPAVQELTSLFQNLSATLEFGHRLDYDLRYQKLALDGELKRMQEMAQNHMLTEVTAIQPVLEHIAADSSVINVARARAQLLLQAHGGR
jgi:hypothetical protein